MAKLLKREYNIKSEKSGIDGVIRDYGEVIKLFFSYEGKEITMGMSRPFAKDMEAAFTQTGISIIDSYIERLHMPSEERTLSLHYWYVNIVNSVEDCQSYLCAHGIVSGHKKLQDASLIHTSAVRFIEVDYEKEEAIIHTNNSIYHCPLAYCRFKKQDDNPELIPDYEIIKEKYQASFEEPTIEEDKVLFVLSNFDEYYFHSMYVKKSEDPERQNYTAYPHVGMFQDSYLVQTEDWKIDIRYFPHFQNIEFYSSSTDGMPLFVENIGDVTLYVKASCGTIRLVPGDRKEVCEENAEDDTPTLANGDLYPAGIIE